MTLTSTVTLEHVETLKSALDKLQTQRFDAILLDLSLPDSHGLPTLERFANHRPHPPIIVLTGLNDTDTALETLRRGAYDYLLKGQIDGPGLIRAIRYAIERARTDEALQSSEASQQALLRAIPDLLFRYSADGIYLDYQAQNEDELAISPDLFLGKPIHEVLPEDQAELVSRHLKLALQEGESQFEQQLGVQGKKRDFEVRMVRTNLGNVMALVRDITERKRGEMALRESEEKFRTVVENLAEGLLLTDIEDRVIYANKRILDLTGYHPDEMIGQRAYELILPEESWGELERQNKKRFEGKTSRYELELRRKDGSLFWAESIGTPWRDADGTIIGTLGVVNDISERKLAEAALIKSERKYRDLMEQASDSICLIHPLKGTLTDVNSALCAMLGYSRDELLSLSVNDFMLDEEYTHGKTKVRRLKIGETYLSERRLRRKDGTLFPAEINVTRLRDNQVQAIIRDITERKEAENALRESEARQRALLEAIPDLLLQYAANGTYLSYHANTWDDLHAEPSAFIGKRIDEVLPPEVADLTQQNLDLALQEGKAKFEYDLEVLDGLKTYEAHMVRTEEGAVLSLIRDITEHKQAKDALKKQNAYLGALHETSLGLMNRLELSELLDSLVKQITSLTGAPHGFIYLINEAGDKLDLAAGVGLHAQHKSLSLSPGQGVAGRVWQTGKPLLIDNYQTWEHSANDPRFQAVNTVLATPLKSNDLVTGIIGIADSSRTDSFSQNYQDLLENFAKLASIAFDNARLYTEAQREIAKRARQAQILKENEARYRELFIASERQANELELLNQIRTLITQQHDLPTLFKTVVDTVAELFGYDKICLALIRDNALEPQYYLGYDFELPKIPLDTGVSGRVARTGKAELIKNVAQDEDYLAVLPNIVSELCIPLFDKDKPFGIINIETSKAAALSEEDLGMMLSLSKQVSIAIENAQLYERVRTDLRRTQALHEISQAITASDSLAELLQTISHNILDAVDAQWVVTYTLDVPRQKVINAASVSTFATPLETLGFDDLWNSLSGWVLREGKSTLSPKTEVGVRENATVTQQRIEQHIGSVIVTPLLFDGKQLGTISVLKHQDEADFTQEDVQLIESIANQVVVALEQRQLLDQIEHQAYHDALTGLPNRLLFEDRLEQSIARAKRSGFPFALLFIDLDGFKHVNDTLGHQIGDELLKAVTKRLSGIMRESDTLARMGGDEFAFILNDLRNPPDAVRVAERYLSLFKDPFVIEGHELFITASIGVCLYPNDGEDAETLLRHSDSAMYRAKHLGKNDVQTFTPDLAEQAHKRLTLENQLRRALEKEELELHYQPQVNLQTGERIGVEALLRWRHSERGLISPGDFIPIAEESNLIVPMGEWVLHEACRQNAQWQREGHPPVQVAVNISPRQFSRPNFIETVESALSTSSLKPAHLELEITESVVMYDINTVAKRLTKLRNLGVRIAIDDFGTGYSSLQYLQRLPIDSLKIDRSFINAISFEEGEETSALVQIIVTMAQTFGLNVVAEGIETEVQLQYLRSLGCQQAQGFYFAKPLPASEVWQKELEANV